MVGKRYPASVRDRIRQYMLAQEPDRKITIQKISAALGIDHELIIKNMSGLIRHGEPFEVVTRAQAWRLAGDDPTPPKQERRPEQDKRVAGMNETTTTSESLTSTRRRDYPGLEAIHVLHWTDKGSVLFQFQDGDGTVWIARKVQE